ncbi:MAG TPA: HutD family protein [Steroidobacteraceae bacterium]|nr:HutD family protein [Steroidobacteraceae bacterium]
MQVIRKSSFRPTPWKNGGGITHEALRVPANGNAFRWRVSVAEIDAPGPFSEFAEYNRKMVLLRGSGVRLTFDGGIATYLRAVGDLAEFDGAIATECALLNGPCVDLNLMVSKSMTGVRAWVECLRAPRILQPSHAKLLAFAISGSVSVNIANRAPATLHEWDLAVVSPDDRGAVGPAALDESAAPLVFFATLDDN